MNPQYCEVGNAFVKHYYETFDVSRANLGPLYRDDSMMTFEGEQFQGATNITTKLVALPFKTVKHVVTTIDCQPTTAMGVFVFVVGQLKTDNDPPHSFSQCFHLMPVPGAQSYYVLNDMFRLSLHHG